MNTEHFSRAEWIAYLRGCGISDDNIGVLFGLTRQRVAQIGGKKNPPPPLPPPILPDAPPETLPAALRAFRARHGLSRAALANELRISHSTLNNWEQGRNLGMAGLVLKLLAALEIIMEKTKKAA